MPKVSIILPVYNVEKYLEKSIGCLINQTLKDIEIICVDDGSKDNSLNILRNFEKIDNRIKIIVQPQNLGQGIARNKAIDIATGDYIMFLDSDDWLKIDACETAYNQILRNKNDFVAFNYNKYFEEDGRIELNTFRLEPFERIKEKPNIKLYEDLSGNYIKQAYTWCQIYNRNFLNKYKIRFSTHRNAEDIPFYIKALMCAETMSVIEKPLYYYRVRKNSTTYQLINKPIDFFVTREMAYQSVLKYEKGTLLNAFLIYYIRSILHWYRRQEQPDSIKTYYEFMHELFCNLNAKHNIEAIKDYIDYKSFKNIVKNNWQHKCFNDFLQNIFSLKNDKTHKTLTVLGIKIKFKRKAK